jgi:TonB-linked SusC/RagA family outer membrane protein
MKTFFLFYFTTSFSFASNRVLFQNSKIKIEADKVMAIDSILVKKDIINGYQQERKINGTVVDQSGLPISGVNISIANTKKGTLTDLNGKYSIMTHSGEVLVFSHVGFETVEKIVDESNVINITMFSSAKILEEVVVTTALGIKRNPRELTYNVQEIKSKDVTQVKDPNFVNSLAGKVAGATINTSSSGIGGATRVVMRGEKSISGDNNVLYVIDGIPVPNPNGGSESTGAFSGKTSGEGISNLNPEDIESISVLTGPSATALYGSQGARGVVIVNTKKGSEGKIKVNLVIDANLYTPFVLPKFQNTYGQANPLQMESWGTKLKTPSNYSPTDFFQTGINNYKSISVSGGTEKSQTFFSSASNQATGIIPNNTYNRNNFYLRHTTNLTDKLTVDFGAMYVIQNDNNMIAQGQYFNPLLPVYLFPPGADFQEYKVYKRYDPNRKIPAQFWPFGNGGLQMQNPYWITNSISNKNENNRYMLSTTANYNIFDWLNITGRVRVDNTHGVLTEKRSATTDGVFASEFGFYQLTNTTIKSIYSDVLVSIQKDINQNIAFNAKIGTSFVNETSNSIRLGGKLTTLANFFSITDNTNASPTQGYGPIRDHQDQAVFATSEFKFKNMVFLNATGRYEWPSALAGAQRKSYFYPSVGVSGVLTDIFGIDNNILSYVKTRFSYAEVGNAPQPGITNPTYSLSNNDFRPAPFFNFLPENTKSMEAGIEVRLFDNKLSLNATVYKSNTNNQLLTYVSKTGGLYTHYYYNAGDIQNVGLESSLGFSKMWGEDFKWNSTIVFSLNRNEIKRLSEGYINPATGEVFGNESIRNNTIGVDLLNIYKVGGRMSDLYITQVLREDNQGNLWVNQNTGDIQKINIQPRYIGHTDPNYNLGWNNIFSYTGLEFSFLIDARVGGIGVSYTQAVMDSYGVSQNSADARNNGGVQIYGKTFPDVKRFYNTIGSASGGEVGLAAYYVYSATNVRLREALLRYSLPEKWLGGKFIKNISVAVNGRNLFMFYNKAPFDPESTSSTGTGYQGIDFFRQPSYRSIGLSVRVQF